MSGLVGVSSVIVFVAVLATTVISLLLSLALIKAFSTQGRLLRSGRAGTSSNPGGGASTAL